MAQIKTKKSPKFPSGKLPSPIIVNLSTLFNMSIIFILIIESGLMPMTAAG